MSFNASQEGYEQDPRWTAVDEYATASLVPADFRYRKALQDAVELSHSEDLPNIEVSPMQGKFLASQATLVGAKHVLEVGTLGGYSTIWLASAASDVHVTTIEVDERHKKVAEMTFAKAGLSDRINVLLGPGVEVLPTIRAQVDAGKRDKFDFVFIDADKPNNLNYLNEAIPMCRTGALIIVDNVVRKGLLADAALAKTDDRVRGSRDVVEAAGKDPRLAATSLLQTVGEKNYDGFLLCVVK